MLAMMNNEFSCIFEETQSEDNLQVLKESFDTPDDVKRYKISCTIFNSRIREGASIVDHVLYMIELIEYLNKLGFFLHE